jgi:hypothetical protein
MPATREYFLIRIQKLEQQLRELEAENKDVTGVLLQLKEVSEEFAATGYVLNENKNLLKG